MSHDSKLTQMEQENMMVFGLKWSVVGVLLAICLLTTGCETFTPPETPRYNAVQGERRPPALNAATMAGQTQQMPPPQAAIPPQYIQPTPTYQAPPPVMSPQPAPVYTAPAPYMQQPINTPAVQPMPPVQPVNQVSMMDHVVPVQPNTQPPVRAQYPNLSVNPPPAPINAPRPLSTSEIEAEIAAMERELNAANGYSQPMPTPDYQNMPQYSVTTEPEPLMAQPMPQYQAKAPSANSNVPPLLPPPPQRSGSQPLPDLSQQPIMDDPFTAPVIDDNTIAAHHSQRPQVAAVQPVSTGPVDVPMPPEVRPASASTVPTGLIPPELADEFGQGYLPPSRYVGRLR